MAENFTPFLPLPRNTRPLHRLTVHSGHSSRLDTNPSDITLAIIRQMARSYTVAAALPSALGAIINN